MVIGNTGGIGNIRHRPAARAEQPAYTNHAGNAVPGIVVALDVDGNEVVRPLTAEDVDTIGKACLFNSVNI